MSKKKGKTPQPAAKKMTASAPKMEAFTFGEPVPVLDRRDILDYVECISNGRWYEPPVSFTGLAKACVLPCITAHRFTSNVIFWPRHLSRIHGFPSRISAALCWIFWYLVMHFWKSVTAPPVKLSGWKPHRQNIPAVVWKRMFTGGCRPSTSRQPSRPAPCFTCWSRILIRSCTACRNISAPLTLPG